MFIVPTPPKMKRERKLGKYYESSFYFLHFGRKISLIKHTFHLTQMDEDSIFAPEFIDISITKRCNMKCGYCYQSAGEESVDIDTDRLFDIVDIMVKEDAHPYQVAIGGGEPSLHPEFVDIIKGFYERKIIPNITTNGELLFKDEFLQDVEEYCGGVAITYHLEGDLRRFLYSYHKLLSLKKIQPAVHIIVPRLKSMNDVEKLRDLICSFIFDGVTVLLLEFRYHGRARKYAKYKSYQHDVKSYTLLASLIKFVSEAKMPVSVGATLAFLVRNIEPRSINFINYEPFVSCYIDERLRLMPNSYWDPNNGFVDLNRIDSFKEAYNSELFKQIRGRIIKFAEKNFGNICGTCYSFDKCDTCKQINFDNIPEVPVGSYFGTFFSYISKEFPELKEDVEMLMYENKVKGVR